MIRPLVQHLLSTGITRLVVFAIGTALQAQPEHALAGIPGTQGPGVQSKRPNVILILCDDLGYGDVAGFGFEDPVTHAPHIDRLATEGVRLTRFLAPMPYCAPSRASLLTGRYPYRNGIVYNPTPDRGIDDYGLDPAEVTVAEVLRGIGYRRGIAGDRLPHRLCGQMASGSQGSLASDPSGI